MRRLTTSLLSVAATLGLGVLAACGGGSSSTGATGPAGGSSGSTASTQTSIPLSVMVFNVEYGGTPSSDAVIKAVHPDVVGVLESYNRLPVIARHAGYPYYDVGLQILSKYPILEPSGAHGRYAYIEVRPGEAVAMINNHLDYVEDGPNRLNHGASVASVMQTEREFRLSTITSVTLPSVHTLLSSGWPLVLTGDLNEPSHLDWTTATRHQHGGVGPVPWPVSKALLGAGLKDSYRVVHPDPVTDPGNTWGGVAGQHGSPRRIDFAYVGGPVEVRTSQVVGERGGPGVDIGFPHWTSDHRAVLDHLQVTPVPMPTTLALSSRLVTRGAPVTAYFQMPDGAQASRVKVTGPSTASYDVSGSSGHLAVSTTPLRPGTYHLTLLDQDGGVGATNELVVRSATAPIHLATNASSYRVGQPITVRWTDGPGNRWDWVAVYKAGSDDPHHDSYLDWSYTQGHDSGAVPPSTHGHVVIDRAAQGWRWPLPPGRYTVHYLLTDQYDSAGDTHFTVR